MYRQEMRAQQFAPQSVALFKLLQAERHSSTIGNNVYDADTMHPMIALWRTGKSLVEHCSTTPPPQSVVA